MTSCLTQDLTHTRCRNIVPSYSIKKRDEVAFVIHSVSCLVTYSLAWLVGRNAAAPHTRKYTEVTDHVR